MNIVRIRVALALVASLLLFPTLAAPLQAATPAPFVSRTLPNGLQVAVVENPTVPLVTIEIGVRNGAMNEPPELNGLSHLYEHMFFKGNAAIPNQSAYLARLRELGAVWNGTTGTERVNYFFTMPASQLPSGLQFMADAIETPRFDAAELAKEQQVVLGEIDRNEADPSYHLWQAADDALWFAHPTYKRPLGTRDAVSKATVEQMRWMQKTYYIPNNSVLVVAGDVQAAKVFALAEKFFGGWKKGPDPFVAHPLVQHPPLPVSKETLVTQPVRNTTLMLYWQGPDTAHDMNGAVAADLFCYGVNAAGSRLQRALVDSGLAYSAHLGYNTRRNAGEIALQISVPAETATPALAVALREASHFGDAGYISADQWRSAQTQLRVDDLYGRERVSTLPHTLTFWWSVGSLEDYVQYVPRAEALTPADGAALARRYVVSHPLVAACMMSGGDQQQYGVNDTALQQILQHEWPTRPLSARRGDAPYVSNAVNWIHNARHPQNPPAATFKVLASHVTPHAAPAPLLEQFSVDGIDVLLRHNSAAPVIAASLYLRGGSCNLTPANAGIEMLGLQVALHGATRSTSRVERSRQLSAVGSIVGVESLPDYSRLDMKCVASAFATTWKNFTDSLLEPAFEPADVELYRRRQLAALRNATVEPDAELRRLAESQFYKGTPYENRPIGSEESLEKVQPAQVASYVRGLGTRSRMLLVVVGDIDRFSLEQALHGTLAHLPRGTYESKRPAPIAARPPALLVEDRALPTTYVRGLFPAPAPGDADYAAASLTTNVLSERLFEEVRTRRNLSYEVFCGLGHREANYGVLYASATDPNAVVSVIWTEIKRLVDTPLSSADLEQMANDFITHYYIGMETSDAQAQQWGDAHIVGGDWRQAARFVNEVRHVTPQQVQQEAAKLFHDLQWAVLGSSARVDATTFKH